MQNTVKKNRFIFKRLQIMPTCGILFSAVYILPIIYAKNQYKNYISSKRKYGGGSNPLIRIFPSPGGRGQGRGVFFNGFDPLPKIFHI
jgi:hypothetical protein